MPRAVWFEPPFGLSPNLVAALFREEENLLPPPRVAIDPDGLHEVEGETVVYRPFEKTPDSLEATRSVVAGMGGFCCQVPPEPRATG